MERIVEFTVAEGAEHENTVTENTIARKIFKANELSAGKIYRGTCGVIVNDNNSTDTLTLAVRFGSTSATPASNTSCAASSAVDSEDADQAVVSWELHVQSTVRAVMYVTMQAPDAKGTGAVTRWSMALRWWSPPASPPTRCSAPRPTTSSCPGTGGSSGPC
jgi:hypothetical protein